MVLLQSAMIRAEHTDTARTVTDDRGDELPTASECTSMFSGHDFGCVVVGSFAIAFRVGWKSLSTFCCLQRTVAQGLWFCG